MKKCLAVTVVAVVALVGCQPIDATVQINKQSKSGQQEEYEEEAYPIGQQEEQYFEEQTKKTEPK